MDDEIGGIIIDEDGGGTKKEEGFTRLVVRLLLLLDSGASWWGARGIAADKGEGICNIGTIGVAATFGTDGGGVVTEDWYGCPDMGALEVFPMVIAACHSVAVKLESIRTEFQMFNSRYYFHRINVMNITSQDKWP